MPHQQDNQQKPLVSFIIPVYNVPADMLTECIHSILRLSLRPFERQIIVVDDGSAPSALDALSQQQQELLYIRQPNAGVAAARNRGLQMAEGTFVQFIDGDDTFVQTPYEHVLDLVRYGQTDMVMFDFCDKPDTKTVFQDNEPQPGTSLMRHANIHGSVWGYIFRRNILGSLRFTPGVAYGEDEEFTAQLLLRAERVVATDACAYFYRQRPASAINRADMRSRLRRLDDAKNVIISLQQKSSTMATEERLALQRRTAQLTMDYIYNVILLTQSRHYLDRRLDELRRKGLFPLPDHNYTKKYTWFRRMTNSNIGLNVLMRTLPLLNKER